MKMAKADILVYADDDIEAFPTWIDGIEEAFQDENVVLVGGKNLPKFEVEPPGWIKKMWEADKNGNRILGYLSILDLGDAMKIINPNHVFGCNFSIRKATLLDAGGFHPDAMPQELIKYRGDGESHVSRYVKEMGYKALYHPKASVYHLVPHTRLTEEYFCSRAYSQGISDSYTQLRDQHLGSNNTNQTHRFGYQYRRLKKMIMPELCKAAIRKIQRHVFPSNMSPHQKIRDHIAVACRQGWEYHQRAVEKDSTLLLYILRTDYISEDAQHG